MRQLSVLKVTGSAILALIAFLWLSGCNTTPKPVKPMDVEKCDLDLPRMQGICGLMGGSGNRREPIEYLDKSVAFPMGQWPKVQNYIHDLEAFIDANAPTILEYLQKNHPEALKALQEKGATP